MTTIDRTNRYNFARDGIAALALDPGTQEMLANIINEDAAYGIRLNAGINKRITATGEQLGEWEVADVVGPLVGEFMLLANLDEAVTAAESEAATLSNAQATRDDLIRAARATGMTAQDLAARTRLSRQRIYQVLTIAPDRA